MERWKEGGSGLGGSDVDHYDGGSDVDHEDQSRMKDKGEIN